jgi:hypothetical protein
VTAVRGPAVSTPLDNAEWEQLLAEACRRGSVQALRLWRELHADEPLERDIGEVRAIMALVPPR